MTNECLTHNDVRLFISFGRYSTIPPRTYARATGRRPTREHGESREANLSAFQTFLPEVQNGALLTLRTVEEDREERERVLAHIRKSKMGKMIHAVRMIVGNWTNWAMVGAGWVGDVAEGMVSGALMYYRSELLITAQSVAEAAVSGNARSVRTYVDLSLIHI